MANGTSTVDVKYLLLHFIKIRVRNTKFLPQNVSKVVPNIFFSWHQILSASPTKFEDFNRRHWKNKEKLKEYVISLHSAVSKLAHAHGMFSWKLKSALLRTKSLITKWVKKIVNANESSQLGKLDAFSLCWILPLTRVALLPVSKVCICIPRFMKFAYNFDKHLYQIWLPYSRQ